MSFLQILTLIGCIGLFLYGMKLLSEALQKLAGDSLRRAVAAMIRNRFTGVVTGLLVTAFVQSSSATTAMVFSFVKAGLVSVTDAVASMLGANVGITFTSWIIAVLGFEFDVSSLVFPLIALSLPFFILGRARHESWGELILGFALIFLAIDQLHGLMDVMMTGTKLPTIFARWSLYGYGSNLLFLLLGMIVSLVLQSTGATFLLTALLCSHGFVSLSLACCMILGFNTGGSLLPVLFPRSGRSMPRAAALSQLLLSLVGVLLVVLSLYPFLFDAFVRLCHFLGLDDIESGGGAALAMALFHTLFNLLLLCLLFPLARFCASRITSRVPDGEEQKRSFRLQYIDPSAFTSSGELVLLQVQKEASHYADETYRMFQLWRSMLDEKSSGEKLSATLGSLQSMEAESDRAELEIAQFLSHVSPEALSQSGEQMCRNIYKVVDELESIADSILHCAVCVSQKAEQRIRFGSDMSTSLDRMVTLADAALSHMVKVLAMDTIPGNSLNRAYNYEDEINNYRNQLRNEMLEAIDRNATLYEQSTYLMMLINECEKIGDYVINVIAAASEK